mmetsp:Transcript_16164/g.63030  ORF Transcript_16164/g.63030 Transcript_16164/m.63030 type:complete len:270 (+) Transcript_16164:2-811(+)
MAGMQEARAVALYLLVEVLTYAKLLFLLLCQWLQGGGVSLPKDRQARRLVHAVAALGDDHLLGMGDYTTLMGPCGCLGRLQRGLEQEGTVRQRWTVVNLAKFGSTSEKWRPPPRGRKDSSSLFYRAFAKGTDLRKCCRFVVLCIGSNDPNSGIAPEQSMENIERTCEDLLALGFTVLLCTLPLFGILPEARRHAEDLNRRIRAYCSSRRHVKLELGLELDKQYFANAGCKGFRGKYFSSRGHQRIADALLERLLNPIRAVEYDVWKELL